MLCMQCGTTNDDDAQVCAYCGAPLANPRDAREPEAADDVNAGTDEPGASPSEEASAQSIWGKEISGLWADTVGKEPFGEAEVEAAAQALIDAQGRFQFLEDGATNMAPNPSAEVKQVEEAAELEDAEAAEPLEAEEAAAAVPAEDAGAEAEAAESEEVETAEPEDAEEAEPEGAEAEAESEELEIAEGEDSELAEGAGSEDDSVETVEVAEEDEDDLQPATDKPLESVEPSAGEDGGDETVEAAPPETSPTSHRYCLRCGQPVEDGVDTCPNCGAPSDEFIVNSAAEVGFVRAGTRPSSYEEDFDIFDRYSSKQLAIFALVITVLVMAIVGGLASMVGDLSFFEGGNGGLDPIAQEGEPEDEQAEEGELAEEEPAEEEPAPTVEAVAPADGLTPLGNLTNGGYVIEHDGWVYYAIPEGKGGWNTTAIGRMREDGSQQSLIYSTSGSDTLVWHLNVMDDRLYFSQDSGSWSANLMSVGLNGSDSRTEGTTKPGTLCQTYEGRVYSSDWSGLWSFDPTWVEGWNCYGGPATDALWRVWASPSDREQGSLTAYYFYQGGSTVSATSNLWEDIWGHDIVWLEEGRSLLNVQPTDEGLWLLVDTNADGLGDEVMHAELDGSGLTTYAQTSGPATRLNAGTYGVFVVVQEGSAMRIERIEAPAAQPSESEAAEGEEGEEASAESVAEPTVTVFYRSDAGVEIAYPSVYGKYLYFGLVSGDSSQLVRMELGHPGQKPEEVA